MGIALAVAINDFTSSVLRLSLQKQISILGTVATNPYGK